MVTPIPDRFASSIFTFVKGKDNGEDPHFRVGKNELYDGHSCNTERRKKAGPRQIGQLSWLKASSDISARIWFPGILVKIVITLACFLSMCSTAQWPHRMVFVDLPHAEA